MEPTDRQETEVGTVLSIRCSMVEVRFPGGSHP